LHEHSQRQLARRRPRRPHRHRGRRTDPSFDSRTDSQLPAPRRAVAEAQCLATGVHDVL